MFRSLPVPPRMQLVDGRSKPINTLRKYSLPLLNPHLLIAAFSKTLHHLFLHPPITLLVPENAVASSSLPSNTLPSGVKRTFYSRNISGGRNRDEPSLLVQSLEGKLDVECVAMVRGAWNRDEGEWG